MIHMLNGCLNHTVGVCRSVDSVVFMPFSDLTEVVIERNVSS